MGGTTELVITGPTTMAINSLFPVSGKTTVISGVTMVEVTGATTVVELSSGSSSTSSPSLTGGGSQTSKGLIASPSSSTKKSGAGQTVEQDLFWSMIGVMVAGFMMAGL